MATVTKGPVIGEGGVISEGRPLHLHCLPTEVGIRRQPVEYTCIDASQQFLTVGSVQGYVWVVDIQSSRLLKEFTESKGSAVTVVKLNPVRDYVAYGTDNGFVRVERLSKAMSNKLCVQEKTGQRVNCIEWSRNGECIFCGYNLGRLVQFDVKFKDGIMKHVPLYPEQYGSSVVQLSASENLLLVSTLDRAFLLDTSTSKLDQVGRKERKSGIYGGCFVETGQTMLVARPGLRLWIADNRGKVLGTMGFKEALSSHHLPAVVINSVPTSPLCFSRSWQFSTLHPMLGGKFVVTFQENTIFVLDPVNGVIVGAASLKDNIKSVSMSGGFLYILSGAVSKAIFRVAVHHSYVTMECEPAKHLRSTLSTPSSSVNNSPKGSLENLCKDPGWSSTEMNLKIEKDPCTREVNKPEPSVDVKDLNLLAEDLVCTNEFDDLPIIRLTEPVEFVSADHSHDTLLIIPGSRTNEQPISCHEEIKEHDSIPNELESTSYSRELFDCEHEELKTNKPVIHKEVGDHAERVKVDTGSRINAEMPTFEKLTNVLSIPQSTRSTIHTNLGDNKDQDSKEQENSEEDSDPHTLSEDVKEHNTKEHSRRLRMSQAAEAGDNIVADSKSHRKRRKRIKGKKLSSATSSTSVSLEKLADITEEQVEEQESVSSIQPVEIEHGVETEDFDDLHNDDEKITKPEQSDHYFASSIEQRSEALEELTDSKGIPSSAAEDSSDILSLAANTGDRDHSAVKTLIDNESGQQFSNEMLESREELDSITSENPSDISRPKTAGCNSIPWSNDVDIKYGSDADIISDCKAGSDVAVLLSEVSDNPLYQDTDEEQVYGSGDIFNQTATTERIVTESPKTIASQSYHSLLQPALSDPLQGEETLETGTTSDRPRFIPADSSNYLDLTTHKMHRHEVTSWVDISEKDSCYLRDQNFDVSDSSHDSEPECGPEADVTESQVADDFYQLCGALLKKTADQPQQLLSPVSTHNQFSQASISDSNSLNQVSRLCEAQEGEVITSNDNVSEGQSMDIWVSVPFPGRHSLQCVCLSDVLLWAVDSRCRVFCTTTSSRGKNWQQIKKAMQQIASSHLGHVVWSIYHQNAYVRLGIGMNPAGSTWKNITRNTSLAHKIKQLAVEENGVWAITIDNRVLFRKGVDERNPEGKVWQEVSYGRNFSYITCCRNIVWALTSTGKVFVREGITPSSPSGKIWTEIKSPSMIGVSITVDGVVWGINNEDSIGFRTGINPSKPGGRGIWWEVTINSDSQAISPFNSLWQVMSAESHLLSSAMSLVSSSQQVTTVSASSRAGVVVLEAGHRLHGCWRMATGYHYTPVCKDGVFQSNVWSQMAAGGTSLWFVRNDGDLYCLSPGSKLKRVEVPSRVELIAASPNCMWVISKDMVWSRQGMTAELPEGISFDYIELSTLLHDKKLRSVACGKKVAWGIDSSGVPHFRFGVHAREPGTGMSPAWVPVEDHPVSLLQIAVCPDDWLVWACDEDYNVYVRSGVTVDFPVGRKWLRIPKQKIKELAATSDRMYGLTPDGELMCRYGISENNLHGSFWRKLPGKYDHITTGAFGELWTLDNKGQVWKQEWKVIRVSDMHTDFDANVTTDPESWEFV